MAHGVNPKNPLIMSITMNGLLEERESARLLDIAMQAAIAAGVIQRQAPPREVSFKGTVNLVTDVDLACEALIRKILGRETPDLPILAEEGGGAWTERTRWIVDPLDGTTNFVHQYPAYGVSIALEIEGVLELGCILDSATGQLCSARRGRGAFLRDQRIHVSFTPDLDSSLLVTGFPYDRREKSRFYMAFFEAFLVGGRCIRRSGCATVDFCHLASGLLDGFWEFNLKPWDVAAGAVILVEAGGRISNMDGSDFDISKGSLLATNGLIHDEMLAVIADVYSRPGIG